jgi:hypothetical protein
MQEPMRHGLNAAAKWALPVLAAAVLAACGGGSTDNRGAVVSTTQTGALTKAQMDGLAGAPIAGLVGGPAKCDVALHKVVYETLGPRGEGARASAGLAIPSGCPGPYPVVMYHHGTTVTRSFTMSDPTNAEAFGQLAIFAAQGYVVVMPDYHGYGDSTLGYHPYLHAENTAAVSIDALRAARLTLANRTVSTSGKLFLSGYSQGGHSAMATHRAMERDHPSEFKVTASVPQSGPYALEQTFVAGIASPTLGASIFSTMTFVGYQKAYGDIYTNATDVFRAPWATGIESLIPGALSFEQLYTTPKLPVATTGEGGLLTSAFVTSVQNNAQAPVRKRLAENSLLNWKPLAPMTLCTGSRDPVVPPLNTTAARTYFVGQGAPVTAVDVETVPAFFAPIAAQVVSNPDLSTYHGTIVPPLCSTVAKNVFDPLK